MKNWKRFLWERTRTVLISCFSMKVFINHYSFWSDIAYYLLSFIKFAFTNDKRWKKINLFWKFINLPFDSRLDSEADSFANNLSKVRHPTRWNNWSTFSPFFANYFPKLFKIIFEISSNLKQTKILHWYLLRFS